MDLKPIDSNKYQSAGYGAGSGETIQEEYQCPCGKGKVIFERDDIPGFKNRDISCTCGECNDKYEFGRGTAKEKSNV